MAQPRGKTHSNNSKLSSCLSCFKVVSDKTKLKICYALMERGVLSVGEISRLTKSGQSLVSHALKKMLACEIVTKYKKGRLSYYKLNNSKFNRYLKDYLYSL